MTAELILKPTAFHYTSFVKPINNMQQHIYTHTIHITSQSNLTHFQFSLPSDAAKITAIQTAASKVAEALPVQVPRGDFIYTRQPLLGNLRLQTSDAANWFYAERITDADMNLGMADYSRPGWMTSQEAHNFKKFPQNLEVNLKSNVIAGVYKDNINETTEDAFAYDVIVYVWYAIKEKT
jgi:hypothetical protein